MPARQLRLLRPAIILLGLGLLASAGCSSGGGTTVVVTHPTMIEIAPERFLGDVPCSEGPGLKRYVATLIDTDYFAQGGAGNVDPSGVEAGGAPMEFQLPSSGPTPCLAAVGFGLVVPGRHYDVKIDGYDTDDLAPRATGSRQMVSPAPTDENPVSPLLTPRWTAHCEDAMAVESTIVQAVHCTPFKPVDAAAPGEVRVNLSALMGGLACGEEPGQVDHFDVTLDAGDGAPRLESIPCASDAEAVFGDLPPRLRVTAYVAAYGAESVDAFAGASCDAFTRAESSVNAECAALSELGTLRIDWGVALATAGFDCSKASIATIQVQLPGQEQPQTLLPPDCLQPFDHGFGPGAAVVSVTVKPADASQAETTLVCSGQVLPGQLALADCDAI